MSYVDISYYKDNFKGDILNDDTLENRLERASDQIDKLTYNRIIGVEFKNLSPFQQDKIKKAVCLQAEFIEQYGEFINMQSLNKIKEDGEVEKSITKEEINVEKDINDTTMEQ